MAPAAISEQSLRLIKKPLPTLNRGPQSTTSSALHQTFFVGTLEEWPNFERDARATVKATVPARNTPVISFAARLKPTPATIDREHVAVGQESGVQGRIQQNVGQVMSAMCKALQIDMCFADYKATNLPRIGRKIRIWIVGEIKVPWVDDHDIDRTLEDGFPRKISQLFGQIAQYMKLANLRYGFLSTYEQTVFFRQIVSNGRWVLQYSEPIKGSTKYEEVLDGNYENRVTVRECFLHLIRLAETHHVGGNTLPMTQWVKNTPY
ncbi:hypothetical protein BDV39DRAFT_191005 [Aspergillus sergii]|uniref:Fungal-type protein kinase domain-containing protein n=1 Tax=Aspergillus sergii TaxID=1034303 RepID=A0A5N6XB26_9EURO|nr:hypothetical protein BDV39DRAFT_191005 [Aspergillus sergii]